MTQVSILDLTAGQIAQVERAVGLPMQKWDQAPSTIDLYCHVLAIHSGRDVQEFQDMPVRQLMAMLDLSGDEASDPGND